MAHNYLSKKTFQIFLVILFSVGLIYFFSTHLAQFQQLALTDFYLLIPIIFLIILQYLIIGLVTQHLLKSFQLQIGIKESFALAVITSFYNIIMPFRAGVAIRAYYLKKKYNFLYKDFLVTISATYLLLFWAGSILGMLSLYFISPSQKTNSELILCFFVIIFTTTTLLMLISPKLSLKQNAWINRMIKLINNWHFIRHNKRVLFFCAVFSFVQLINTSFLIQLQFGVFGIHINLFKSTFLAVISYMGMLVGITPSGLGIKETLVVVSAATIGIAPIESLSVALLGRLVTVGILCLLGPILSYYFGIKIKEFRKIESI